MWQNIVNRIKFGLRPLPCRRGLRVQWLRTNMAVRPELLSSNPLSLYLPATGE